MERTVFGLLLAKQETTYGTDPVPVASANVIPVMREGVKFSPNFTHLTRKLLDGTLSKVSGLNTMPDVSLDFEVELRGNRTDGVAADISSGSAVNAIEINALLKACDMQSTYTAETTGGARNGYVIYNPVVPSNEGNSVTFYFYSGLKLHKIVGGKGTFRIDLSAGQFGKIAFSFKGKYQTVTDASVPGSITWLDTKPPTFKNALSTIDTYSPVFSALTLDVANKVDKRLDANSTDAVAGFLITDRDSKCTIDPESVAEATSPIWADLEGGQARTITAVVGSQSGNKITVTVKGVSQQVSYGDRSGIRTQPIDYSIERANVSDSANSEIAIKFG